MTSIALTGATGRLGGRVARRLAARSIPQTLLVRDPARAPHLPGATVTVGGFTDGEAVKRALDGAPVVLMVSAAESPDRVGQHRAFVDAAAAAGVGHLVYVSFAGAAPDATFTHARDHWHTEQHIRAAGLPFTFLRDNLYADFLPDLAGTDGVIRGPAGDGRVAVVALDDIAEVAEVVLTAPGAHAGQTYELTGPEALSLHEIAGLLAVRYVPETLEEAHRSRAGYGAPDWLVEAWVSTYTAIAAGDLAGVSDAVPRLTGHRAKSVAELFGR